MKEFFMRDCIHWNEKKNGRCPWEENSDNCNNCQDYNPDPKVKILDSEIMDKIAIQDSLFKEKSE